MAGSDITITALTATPTLRGTKLVATVNDPRNGAIPNLAADAVEFYAATVNNFASATKVVEGPGVASGNSEAVHEGLIEETAYYYWALARNKIGSQGAKYPVSGTGGVSATAIGMSGLTFGMANGQIVVDTHATDAAVPTNALRIAWKTQAGADPSPADPIFVAFADTAGRYAVRTLMSSTSLTIPDGATLGVPNNNEAFKLWPALIYDSSAGLVKPAVIQCRGGINGATPTAVRTVTENIIETTVLITSAADNGGTFYAESAFTGPVRMIAALEWPSGLATAGSWATGPSTITLKGPGTALPGTIVQVRRAEYRTAATVTGASGDIPVDDTIPQQAEGTTYANLAISFLPTSKANLLRNAISLMVSRSNAGPIMAFVYISSGSGISYTVVLVASRNAASADVVDELAGMATYLVPSSSLVPLGYGVNVGGTAGASINLNGITSARRFGGALVSSHEISEIQT